MGSYSLSTFLSFSLFSTIDCLVDFQAILLSLNFSYCSHGLRVELHCILGASKVYCFQFWKNIKNWAFGVGGNSFGLVCVKCYFETMKVSGIWVLCMLVGTALMLIHFSCGLTSLSIADFVFTDSNGSTTMVPTSRKLKENGYVPSMGKRSDARNVNLEDYRPINPVPSSKASIRPGPIEHGTPLNPFIPKPSPPPGRPKNGGFY